MKRLHNVIIIIIFSLITFCINYECVASINSEYYSLKNKLEQINNSRRASRGSYASIAKEFYNLYLDEPNSFLSDNALYMAGEAYSMSYKRFKNKQDLREALKYYRLVAVNYSSNLAVESYLKTSDIYIILDDYVSAKFMLQRLVAKFPDHRKAIIARERIEKINSDLGFRQEKVIEVKSKPNKNKEVEVTRKDHKDYKDINHKDINKDTYKDRDNISLIKNIRYWSSDTYTRVVIDLTKKAEYKKHWLREDPKHNKPPRLYIDIKDVKVAEDVAKKIPIKDGLVSAIRWGYFKKDVTRIVLDSQNIKDFTVFSLENPNRIVIDVSGDEKGQRVASKDKISSKSGGSSDTLAGVFGLKVKRIVIDPGHGGKDPGATYYGLYEKDIVLDIALELKRLFEENTSIKVFLTRSTDVFIPLEERTAIANKKKADVFVSIHVNASKNRSANGVETYVLNVTDDKEALKVAAFENQASERSLSDLQSILKDILLNSKLEESKILAKYVQNDLVKEINEKSLGVKQAPFYVLVGATMPSILVETGFLSSKRTANKFRDISYRKKVAKGIYYGLLKYIKKYNGES
ncbi:MAG: N-acetylmuramoyl-L-alanine amidase [Deferribacterota bacterium]|nr:N-acetylmuramoyl-L-alanine amidase [Deferribacterota bacterium]